MQILSATDHAELTAEISGKAVSRIALEGDRIARVVRAPDGFTVEHDAARGDLYLRPAAVPAEGRQEQADSVTLFIGTEQRFTYRLMLTVAERDSAQILIRNADVVVPVAGEDALESDPYRSTLVALIRAIARREPLPDYVIEAAATEPGETIPTIETWRGPRFTARVLEAPAGLPEDAAHLASLSGPGIAAAWMSTTASGPAGGRLAVIVHGRRTASDGEAR